jgi:hypothetical protein
MIVIVGAGVLYMSLLTTDRFGSYHDDSIYVSTAKALATGQGYRLINLPGEPAQTKYPPLYPFLLSLIWRIGPDFPANLIPMMLLSTAATLGFLALTWQYLVKSGYAGKWQALLIVALTAFNWRTMILASSIYSEMVYALLSVAALYFAERDSESSRWRRMLPLGLLVGFAFLTRSAGVALLIALAAYFVFRRRWKGLIPCAIGALFVLGWFGWCYANKSNIEGVNAAYYTSYLGHLGEVVRDLQAQRGASILSVLAGVAVENLVGIVVSIPVVCLGLSYDWMPYLGGAAPYVALSLVVIIIALVAAGALRQVSKGSGPLHIYVIALLGLHLAWLPGISYDRFLMPIAPFLLLYVTDGARRMAQSAIELVRSSNVALVRLRASLLAALLIGLTGLTVYQHVSGIHRSLNSLGKATNRAAEDAEAIAWINSNADPSAVILCYRDPMYFLFTGRRAMRLFPMKAGIEWRQDPDSQDRIAALLLRIIAENKGRYLVVTSTDFELEAQPELQRRVFRDVVEARDKIFRRVFESQDRGVVIYETSQNDNGDQR